MTKEQMAERIRARQAKKDFPFSPEQYQDMKSDGLSDAKIIAKYKLNTVKLNQWKNEHNLIRKDTTKTPAAKPAKLDDETKSMLSGLKDKLNAPKTSQPSQDKPVEDKTATSQQKEKEPVSVDIGALQGELKRISLLNEKLESDNERLSGKLNRVNEKNAELAAENDRLYKTKPAEPDLAVVDEMKAENERFRKSMLVATADLEIAQSEIHTLTEQVRELEKYRADYEALQQLHREILCRLHAVEEENAALTGTETEHIQLMRRHVQLYDRMQGVYEA